MDAIEMLTTQHAEVEALFEKLEQEHDEVSCRELVGRLVDRLTMHAALEEEIFYPAVAAMRGGAELTTRAREEHQQMKRLLDGLRDPHATKHVSSGCVAELHRTVGEHVAEEEREMMPRARMLGIATLRDLAERMETRIHGGEVAEVRAVAGQRR
jgi:hypothetical protein